MGLTYFIDRWHRGYQPTLNEKGLRVAHWRLRIDLLQIKNFTWMPYSALEPPHMMLRRAVTALIYFVVIKWHQVDRVLPQLGRVQHRPRVALDIYFLMSKDDRVGD
ncbi:hypothetical protein Ahy_B01g057119 [Arachis hypogaea]|uniref:Aminotransferase-like plant mobile domain-containing protein n=1 Tax=Arachis hypogaea TaxID=3818 RepID=A0A445B0D0_ARAHY|nr:hypothetical protein Ahy_B01g057119 [Arachis hypogaea]